MPPLLALRRKYLWLLLAALRLSTQGMCAVASGFTSSLQNRSILIFLFCPACPQYLPCPCWQQICWRRVGAALARFLRLPENIHAVCPAHCFPRYDHRRQRFGQHIALWRNGGGGKGKRFVFYRKQLAAPDAAGAARRIWPWVSSLIATALSRRASTTSPK